LPERTVSELNPVGGVIGSTEYAHVISDGLRNPRREVWKLEVDRQVTSDFLVRVAYQQCITAHDSYLNPVVSKAAGIFALSGLRSDF
jgi:hypothetical protein